MIPLPQAPKVVQKKGHNAIFEIKPLYPGYGITVGNSYRRVLLSSLEGAAITEVKIKGISHEFGSISGILEDALVVLLNLKKIRFKNWSDEPQTVILQVKGEKQVKAKDFKPNPEIKIANPEVHIATLTEKKAELNIEAKVERGTGYVIAEERDEKKNEIGVVSLDAAFTPVTKVSFNIENVIVGKRTDFEKLEIEVETDGTIAPEEAFSKATTILCDHFSLFSEFGKEEPKKPVKKAVKDDPKKTKVEDTKLSERTRNALINNSLKTMGGIVRKTEKDLLALEGMGKKGVDEVKKLVKKLGLELKA